jgi:hypothetical protein
MSITLVALTLSLRSVYSLAAGGARDGFTILVVDDQTDRGVPLVELRTNHQVRYVTDSNGIAYFREPDLMGQAVFFHVKSHGYEFAKDGFGAVGRTLQTTPGGRATLRIKRKNIAQRLYRITGAGIYADSVLAGRPVPLKAPLLNGLVLGQDGAINALYHGHLYWFWGDTNRAAHPLGNFQATGATSALPGHGGLDPDVGVDLSYFVGPDGFAKGMAPMPGDGATWLDGLTVLRDGRGTEHLFANYYKVRPPFENYARGLAEFDDTRQEFRQAAVFPMNAPTYPGGHTFLHTDDGDEYVYFAKPFPLTRVRATPADIKELPHYETFTCLRPGSRLDHPQIERGADGRPVYAWKRYTPAVGPQEQHKLVADGFLKPHEGLLQLRDRDSGKAVLAHAGSVAWNRNRGRWVLIAVEIFGSSFLGEVWYAEADTPLGPWTYAVKVVTHDRYSFYNPKQHPLFEKDNGRFVYFEGTYSISFSGNNEPTARYDYNQVMYKLDLADSRLALPVAVYQQGTRGTAERYATAQGGHEGLREAAFFALDRPVRGLVPVYAGAGVALSLRREETIHGAPSTAPLFYAYPGDTHDPPSTTTPLYEWRRDEDGRRTLATEVERPPPGYRRAEKPLCRVWANPRALSAEKGSR